MDLNEAMNQLDRDERFKCTTATINALLLAKGIYTSEEFESYFVESAKARIKKQTAGHGSEQA